jgi:DNA-binding helix-hairpin-helix protein with protein kinase domain
MSFLPPHLQHLQHLQGDDLKAAVQQEYYTQAIAFIVRQTDYTEETAAERLNALKDPVKVVQAYLGLDNVTNVTNVTNSSKSKNQIIYGEIRKFMDAGAKQYNAQKELNERRKKYQEYLEQQQHSQSP